MDPLSAAGPARRRPGHGGVPAEVLVRLESSLLAPRFVLGVAAVPVLLWYAGGRLAFVVVPVGVLLVAVSGYAWWVLGSAGAARVEALARTTLLADTAAALAAVYVLSKDPAAPAAIVLPLVVFEYALKFGGTGLGIGAVLAAGTLAARAVDRAYGFGDPPRAALIGLLAGLGGLLAGLAVSLRSAQRARFAAAAERDRIRTAFRDAVQEALRGAGVSARRLAGTDLSALVQMACAEPGTGAVVGQRLAALLAPDTRLLSLTRRERDIAALLRAGLSTREIGAKLFISTTTVRVHVSNMMAKFGVSSREQLTRALRPADGPPPAGPGHV